MTRAEALQVAKPILFNTEMVRAIQNGTKTATRRLVKSNKTDLSKCRFVKMSTDPAETRIARNGDEYPHDLKGLYATFEDVDSEYFPLVKLPYQVGNVLYVRETWCKGILNYGKEQYYYRADNKIPYCEWHPSIHMPKEAARIFLRVTGIRVERLQDMKFKDFIAEGVGLLPEAYNDPDNAYFQAKHIYEAIWNSTIKKSDLAKYGWDANPWVWVIEFEKLIVTE